MRNPAVYSDEAMFRIGKITALKKHRETIVSGDREYNSMHESMNFRARIKSKALILWGTFSVKFEN